MSLSQASVSLLLSEKELEIARLREQALTSLEGKVHSQAAMKRFFSLVRMLC